MWPLPLKKLSAIMQALSRSDIRENEEVSSTVAEMERRLSSDDGDGALDVALGLYDMLDAIGALAPPAKVDPFLGKPLDLKVLSDSQKTAAKLVIYWMAKDRLQKAKEEFKEAQRAVAGQ